MNKENAISMRKINCTSPLSTDRVAGIAAYLSEAERTLSACHSRPSDPQVSRGEGNPCGKSRPVDGSFIRCRYELPRIDATAPMLAGDDKCAKVGLRYFLSINVGNPIDHILGI